MLACNAGKVMQWNVTNLSYSLSVRSDPSDFAPLFVIYRSVGTHKCPVAPSRRPPFSVAAERSYTRVGDGAVPQNSPRCVPVMDHGGA